MRVDSACNTLRRIKECGSLGLASGVGELPDRCDDEHVKRKRERKHQQHQALTNVPTAKAKPALAVILKRGRHPAEPHSQGCRKGAIRLAGRAIGRKRTSLTGLGRHARAIVEERSQAKMHLARLTGNSPSSK